MCVNHAAGMTEKVRVALWLYPCEQATNETAGWVEAKVRQWLEL